MAKIGGQTIDEHLLDVQVNQRNDMLVRTWAAAARVSNTRTLNGLIEKASLIQQFPSLGRPIGMRIVEMMKSEGETANPEKVISATLKVPSLQSALAPAILAFGAEELTNVMTNSSDDNIRRAAAGYLGALANQGHSAAVAEVTTSKFQFDRPAKTAPWNGGALFLPGIRWTKEDARQLVGNLIRWHLWCDTRSDLAGQEQIHNNLRSVGLARVAGYQSPGWQNVSTSRWLSVWGKCVGRKEIETILDEQGLLNVAKYSQVLDQLKR